MKKRVLVLFGISIVAFITIIIIIANSDNHKSNKNDNDNNVFSRVDLKTIDDLIIGSELPKLLYSDKEKVIFDCCGGVYVYNMKKKILTQSFDIFSFMSGKYSKCFLDCFVSKDGKQLFFGFFNGSKRLIVAYTYSFENNHVKELTEKEFRDYLKKAFMCTYLDYNDKLYQKCHGTIASISDNEYVYLTFRDWKLSTINVVCVNKGNETHYRVFDKN